MNGKPYYVRQHIATFLFAVSVCGLSWAEESAFRSGLNDSEKAWLAAHPVIRYAHAPNYAPIEFMDSQGRFAGMAADYVKLIAGRLGVELILVHVDDWAGALTKARDREVDMLPAAVDTADRRQYMLFSSPYLIMPTVLVTARHDLDEMPFAEMARSLKLAIIRGSSGKDLIYSENPKAQLVETPDIETALEAVSFGVADVMLGDLASTSYFVGKLNISNLRVVRRLGSVSYSMAVRNDWPQFVKLLDKSLADITDEEKRSIETAWIHLESYAWWRNTTYRLAAIGILCAVLVTALATLIWNRALVRRVRSRTLALEEAHLRLMQSDKLESVGRLAAGVAHEVKNPLAIIQMGVDYLAADIPEKGDGAAVISDMEDAIHRADSVIKGLLDFSREKELDLIPTDLNEVLRLSLKLVRHEFTQHNIEVEESLTPNLPQINADPNKLEQVFINLFMNALQAMGHDGKLMVSSEVGELKLLRGLPAPAGNKFSAADRVIQLKVEDTGPGVDPAKVSKVFDPFFTTKPVGQGTGLGLSVSRTIVELHDGVISLHNRDGGGASVVLLFKAYRNRRQ